MNLVEFFAGLLRSGKPRRAEARYYGKEGKLMSRGGRPPQARAVLCVRCHGPLGLKGSSPAVKTPKGLAHAGCLR